MRILYDISMLARGHYIPRARTGVFRVVENLAGRLATSPECEVVFCVAENVNEPLDFLRTDPRFGNIPISLSRTARFWRTLYGHVFDLTERIEAEPSRAVGLSLKGLRKLLYHAAEGLKPYAKPFSPQILSTVDIYHSSFYPIPTLARKHARVKKFLTLYDLIPVLHPQFFEADVNQLILGVLKSLGADDYALCISEATKNDLCNYRSDLDPKRVFVTHLAASELFRPCRDGEQAAAVLKKYGIPANVPYFLGLSTLEPRKNIDQLIKCFARLVREAGLKDVRLVLTGVKGWNYGKIFDAMSSFGHPEDYIILTGYVADEDLAALYTGALAFVYLSLYEGFGLPPLEAMQCGTPVITSNRPSLPEVVGDAGMMLDPYDEDGICQAMFDLYNDAALREQMSRQSLERAQQFSWDRCVSETIAAYRIAVKN